MTAGSGAPGADELLIEDDAAESEPAEEGALGSDRTSEEAGDPAAHGVLWEEAPAEGAVGREVIAAAVRRLPNAPGVYRMIGADGAVLYVGKAKSLRKRVANYARPTGLPNRIARMVRLTAQMDFVRTGTETEALLLEANLIKRLRPRFNVLLRDDKSFPYILITEDHPAPALAKHRGARRRKGSYYGPFASSGAVDRTLSALQKAFLIRSCSDAVFESRTRPCLLFQIKRCSGPCTGEVAPEDYAALVGQAKAFLAGKSKAVTADLGRAMEEASEALDFERAALYRDRLTAISVIQSRQDINPRGVDEADVFALHAQAGQTSIQVFFFRTGQNWGNRSYFPRADAEVEPEEVLGAFLAQFYDDKPVPPLILVSHEPPERTLLEQAPAERAGRAVRIAAPQRGEKRALVEHALSNAREALARRLSETASQARLLDALAATLGLPHRPRRIEVYDNSHVMGTNAVGAMIVAGPEGFAKAHYRKFNIKSDEIAPGDDYGMMREVLGRRFARLLKEGGPRPAPAGASGDEGNAEEPEGVGAWPDLVMIDGGRGQLAAAKDVLDELGLSDLPVVAVAKGRDRDLGRETFHMPGREPFLLPHRDPVLYLVQRLRDEAHRFAISAHRQKRAKAMGANPLDEIPGIGPTRKRALMRHFGTAKAVARAGLEDLKSVEGISAAMAEAIYGHFHDAA